MSIIYSLLAMQLYITLIAAVLSVHVTQYGTQEARVDLGVTCLSRGKSVARKWWVKSANFHSLITFSSRIVYQHSELHFSFVSEPVGLTYTRRVKKVKVVHARLPSVGFRSWSRFLAVSLHVTWVINPVVGCHYFPPSLPLPSQP